MRTTEDKDSISLSFGLAFVWQLIKLIECLTICSTIKQSARAITSEWGTIKLKDISGNSRAQVHLAAARKNWAKTGQVNASTTMAGHVVSIDIQNAL